MWKGEWWAPRELYCESTFLSVPKENTPFAAMIYDKERMQTASPEQIRELLTFMCSFMDADTAWDMKKASAGKNWPQSPTVDGSCRRDAWHPYPLFESLGTEGLAGSRRSLSPAQEEAERFV